MCLNNILFGFETLVSYVSIFNPFVKNKLQNCPFTKCFFIAKVHVFKKIEKLYMLNRKIYRFVICKTDIGTYDFDKYN